MLNELQILKDAAEGTKEAMKALNTTLEIMSHFTKIPAEQFSLLATDWIQRHRIKNNIEFLIKTLKTLEKRGITNPSREVPLKEFLPILQNSSLEDDEYMQQKWANLMASTVDGSRSSQSNLAFINILNELSSLEVRILDLIYSDSNQENFSSPISTSKLPKELVYYNDIFKQGEMNLDSDTLIAISNLGRLRCIDLGRTLDSYESLSVIRRTHLGRMLVEICKDT